MAPYTRCNSHALNLVIVHACKNTDITHTLTKMKEVCIFFKYSPKREGLLEAIIKQGAPSAERRKPMLDLCKTRWAERHQAYEHFYQAYVFIVEALEYIYRTVYISRSTTLMSSKEPGMQIQKKMLVHYFMPSQILDLYVSS